ncbi:histone deacetylase [Desulfosarcina sp.]|uniref:histone deacetylase family protein n=1 Tax=Desulfosarcina sp. TaxID=2027861 RepID=UPI0035645D3A
MIKREHLGMAIEAVYAVDRESGYGLRELFDAARISIPTADDRRARDSGGRGFYYYFEGERVDIPKTDFVAEGIATLEQSLVLKLGELREKQIRAARWVSGNVRQLAGDIRRAGAEAVVDYELRRLAMRPEGLDEPLRMPDPKSPGQHFSGHLSGGQAVRFMPLPLVRAALLQVAGPRFEFFNVRFILRGWSDGTLPWIYACISRQQVLGLVKLQLHRQAVNTRIEVRYIARRMPQHLDTETPPKGVGTFLLAGVWMLWHTCYPQVRHIFLDGEVGARKFYLDCGFREQRSCRYVLETPGGYLLTAIADMADDSRPPTGSLRPGLESLIGASIKRMQRGSRGRSRESALRFINRCLMARHQPYPATTALARLLKYQHRIPEATALIDVATRTGKVRIAGETPDSQTTVLIVNDARFALHLQGVFHLESPKRVEAFNRALAHASIAGRWHAMAIEPADQEQLLWVHTADYLERLEKTSGRQLVTLDLDTQTTERSWEVACLAVGGVFRLMDGICGGLALRGIAAVRPPGHHAEPDRAMGFCLLNNVALAARYLQRIHGVGRIMIVDLDAHHGNGTQAVFYDDDSVLFVSTHRFPAYPGTGNFGEIGHGRGRGFNVNIPMDRGAGDREYATVIHRIIDPLADGFKPEFILVSLGFDLYLHDRLGGMRVTPEGYGMLTAKLIQMADRQCRGRIAFVLEGGYSVKGIEACGIKFLQRLCQPERDGHDRPDFQPQRFPFVPASISKVIEVQKAFWPQLV